MAYATGKFALGSCDRCGFQCDYLDMMKEWNGLKVCQECFESKQPQLTPAIPRDIETLFEPRPTEPETASHLLSHCKSVTAYPTRPPHSPETVIATTARTLAFTEGTEEADIEIDTPDCV